MKNLFQFRSLHFKVICSFFVSLIISELIIGWVFANAFSEKLEQVRNGEFRRALANCLQQTRSAHESKLTGYAWWTELAQAIDNNDYAYIKEAFIDDASLVNEYDVVELVRGDLHHIWSSVDGQDLTSYDNAHTDTEETALGRRFIALTDKSYKDIEEKLKRLPAREKWPSLTKPLDWHFVANYRGKLRLLTISPICDNLGYTKIRGYILIGQSLQKVLDQAERVLPVKVALLAKGDGQGRNVLNLPGLNPGETFQLGISPKMKISTISNVSLLAFIAIQILLSATIFLIISPYFAKKHTKHLQDVITERTNALQQTAAALTRSQGTVRTLTGLLPICSVCKKIRNDENQWLQLEEYITERSEAEFSHGICHECAEELYPGTNEHVASDS